MISLRDLMDNKFMYSILPLDDYHGELHCVLVDDNYELISSINNDEIVRLINNMNMLSFVLEKYLSNKEITC